MLGSFRIGTVFGITVRVHWLFLAMLVFFTLRAPAELWWWFPMLGVIVFLHELGHSLVAQSFGIRVVDITFWPLGGMARMTEIPEDTRKEALIAIAGPGVNFVLAGLAAPTWLLLEGLGAAPIWIDATRWFLVMNLGLGIFNLVPAFPMDGGRVLRALLGARGDWVRATEQAVHVGRLIAVLMALIGIFTGNFILPLIAVWLWFVGGQERAAVRMRHARDPLGPFRELFRRAAQGSAAFGGPPLEPEPQAPPSAPPGAPPRGFTREELDELERFRGPLRQFRRDEG